MAKAAPLPCASFLHKALRRTGNAFSADRHRDHNTILTSLRGSGGQLEHESDSPEEVADSTFAPRIATEEVADSTFAPRIACSFQTVRATYAATGHPELHALSRQHKQQRVIPNCLPFPDNIISKGSSRTVCPFQTTYAAKGHPELLSLSRQHVQQRVILNCLPFPERATCSKGSS